MRDLFNKSYEIDKGFKEMSFIEYLFRFFYGLIGRV